MNDQYKGPAPWDDFLSAVEASSPTVRALGITDYYVTDVYEAVCEHKALGRLSDVDLIFPNVEMRLSIGTKAGSGINIHLLVDPTAPDHLDELKRFLGRIHFEALSDTFACAKSDLIKLGYASDRTIKSDSAALAQGVNQFKVDFTQLREELRKSAWAHENMLIAVAAGSTDGTSGLKDSSFETTRAEVEKFADIIFSGQPTQRQFWLGAGVLTLTKFSRSIDRSNPACMGATHTPLRLLLRQQTTGFRGSKVA